MKKDKLSQIDLSRIFSDVRKAYRLLYSYQSRVKDLVKYIGDYFGYDYSGGYPWFSNNSPKNGSGKLSYWSWDWLNMYLYEFLFHEKKINEDTIRFAIIIMSDSGYFDSNLKSNIKRTDIENFQVTDNSKTNLILLITKNTWNPRAIVNDYDKWQNNEFVRKDDFNKLLIAKTYPLENFFNQEQTDIQLRDFTNFCKYYDIIIEKFSSLTND